MHRFSLAARCRALRLALRPVRRPTPRHATSSLLAVALAAALVAPSTGCVTDKVTGEKRFAAIQWDTQEEQALGDQSAPNFEQQFGGAYPDAAAQAYLEGVVKEMASHSVRKDDFAYKFTVLNSAEPNAFALPGGYVYITRGLLENLGSEAEFVAILGHELGHVEHQHSMLQQNKQIAAQLLLGAVGIGEELLQKDPDSPRYVSAIAGYAAPLALLSFSRGQELESDERGVYFAHVMGYDPREMKKTFEYFARLEAAAGSSTPAFLRTHPTNETRIRDIDATIRRVCPEVLAKQPAQFRAPVGPKDRFTQIVAAMKQQAPAYQKQAQANALLESGDAAKLQQALGLAKEAVAMNPSEPSFHCLQGEIEYSLEKGDRGKASFEKARALQLKATPAKEYWKPTFFLGLIDLESDKAVPAATSLRRATALFPDQPVAHYYLAQAEEKAGNKPAAAAAYARAAELTPADSALHQKSLERQGQLSSLRQAPARRR